MSGEGKKTRVLLSKMGLDGHDIGIRVVSALLRDHGFEVIYQGLYQTAEAIVHSAIQEDVDVIGLSFQAGEHLFYTSKAVEALDKNGVRDMFLLVGGVIPEDDILKLKDMGVDEVFVGKPVKEIAEYIKRNLAHDGKRSKHNNPNEGFSSGRNRTLGNEQQN